MTKLHELHDLGQSVWLDYIRRDLIDDGGLQRLVDEGLRGLTSNPTIFQKAIGETDLYDERIRDILADDPELDAPEVFERIAVADIRDAADILRPVYDDADGHDGFVSYEVAPSLAYDTQRTIDEARRLWSLIDRPNLLIKVPATKEGIPAIARLLAEGINVNITLMFSLHDYEAVAHAFLLGIDHAGDPSRVGSVASFFVSRVDTKVDDALEKVGTDEALALRGQIAVANSRLAYRRYQEIFESELFEPRAQRGARPQRVLWASTSTKNPDYSDVLYVEELIAPNTVNTMPLGTIDAFRDHGEIRGRTAAEGVDEARGVVERLVTVGVDLDEITEELQREGVEAFADSFDSLLRTLEEKIAELR